MNGAVLGYEQQFFINGTQLSGVQTIEGSYAIQERPINILGWGHVNDDYHYGVDNIEYADNAFLLDENGFRFLQETTCARGEERSAHNMAVLDAPLEGDFNINSILVSEDFFLQFLGDEPFTGSVHHGSKYFGFYSGYITNHSVSCNIGQLPTTSTSIKVFGDIGGSPDFILQENEFPVLNEEGYKIAISESYNNGLYNASGDNPYPEIRLTNQGSIIVECTGASTDRVTSFQHSVNIPIDPIYVVGSAYAAQVDVVWPVTTETSFTLDIDEYAYQSLRKYMRTPTVQDIAIKINDCFGEPIQHYTVKNARLIAESMSASVDGRLTVNLQYKSYYNKRGEKPHENDINYSKFKEKQNG